MASIFNYISTFANGLVTKKVVNIAYYMLVFNSIGVKREQCEIH